MVRGPLDRVRARWRRARELRRASAWMSRWLTPPAPSSFAGFGPGAVVEVPHRADNPQFVTLGAGAVLEPEVWLSASPQADAPLPRIVIGDGARVGRHSAIACTGSVEIGRDAWIGDGVFIGDSYHEYRAADRPVMRQGMSPPRPVRVGDRAVLGPRSVVLGGVTIGDEAVVDPGAVVISDVPARCRASGNPARVVASWDEGSKAWRPV